MSGRIMHSCLNMTTYLFFFNPPRKEARDVKLHAMRGGQSAMVIIPHMP